MLKVERTLLEGVQILHLPRSSDLRGSFAKTFHAPTFVNHNLSASFVESFVTISNRDVIRGMHFQAPPNEHIKLVTCIAGEILDVIVDLRRGQPTYGQSVSVKLSTNQPMAVYIPKGCAHGFLVTSKQAITLYHVSSVYHPESDSGIHWDSIGITWPVRDPIVSERDAGLPLFADFQSPF